MSFRVASGGGTGGGASVTLQTNGVANASQTLLNLTNGANVTITDGGGGAISIAATQGAALNQVSAATGAATIANANNTGIVWNWAITTDAKDAFTFGETSAATGGTIASGIPQQNILRLSTLAASTASPLRVDSRGGHVFSVGSTTRQILATDGTAAAPAYSFASDTGMGLRYFGGAFSFYVAGVEQLRLVGAQVLAFAAGSAGTPCFGNAANTGGIFFPANATTAFADGSKEIARFVGGANINYLLQTGVTFANLPAASNGATLYCSDCDPATLINTACASSGAKTGAMAARVNAQWICYT